MQAAGQAVRGKYRVDHIHFRVPLPNSETRAPLATMVVVAGILHHYGCTMLRHTSVSWVNEAITTNNLTDRKQTHQRTEEDNGLRCFNMGTNRVTRDILQN